MFKKAHRNIWANIGRMGRGERPENHCNGL
jgi:hypothetical protein